jgi:FAD dependent oxidoreductase
MVAAVLCDSVQTAPHRWYIRAVSDIHVVVIGGGMVGVAVAHALRRRGIDGLLLEAEEALGSKASATNSGILHTGFDSMPGELETRLILRSAQLRAELELGVPVVRCGPQLVPRSDEERATVRQIAEGAARNGLEVHVGDDGTLEVPGESITDPVGYVLALAEGLEVRFGARVDGIEAGEDIVVHTAGGERGERPPRGQLRGAVRRRGRPARRRRLLRDLPAQGRVPRLPAPGWRAARADPAAHPDQRGQRSDPRGS